MHGIAPPFRVESKPAQAPLSAERADFAGVAPVPGLFLAGPEAASRVRKLPCPGPAAD